MRQAKSSFPPIIKYAMKDATFPRESAHLSGGLKSSLRSIMYRRIVIFMLVCGFVASACVFFAAETLFRNIYDGARESSLREAESRLDLFDATLSMVEKESLSNGRRALEVLGKRYPTYSSIAASTEGQLAEEARELDIGDIYFIDAEGRVFATSFATDRGLMLSALGSDFAAFLRGIYGKGQIVDQRVSQSTLTGTMNSYQYFSSKGSDFIIEVSTRLDTAVDRSLPNLGFDRFMRMVSDTLGGTEGTKPLARVVDIVGVRGISTWSIFQRKVEESPYASLVEGAKGGENPVVNDWDSMTTVKKINFPFKEGNDDSTYYAIFKFDLVPLRRFRIVALLTMLLACGLATGISFALMKRSFDWEVATRIDGLRAALARAAGGDFSVSFADFGDDEIGAIGASVGSMMRTMLDNEEKLRAAELMETTGAMAGGLAHDFSNILTGISGTIECMELSLEDGEVRAEELLDLAAIASKTAKRGGELVHALLDLSSPRPSERGPIDLCAIAREAAALARGKDDKEVSIRVETPQSPLVVRGDGQAILRAALNLCINGVQAMTAMRPEGESRGGTLLVCVQARPGSEGNPDEAAIMVKDEGVGIAPEERSKIFVPFYSTKPRGLGAGIGLSIVLSVAKSHGGRLELESEPGRGSTFTLVLPA
jgi:signal transduction histidine kinase